MADLTICSSATQAEVAPEREAPMRLGRGLASSYLQAAARATKRRGLPDEQVYHPGGHGRACAERVVQGAEAGHGRVLVEDVWRRGVRARAPGMAEGPARAGEVLLRVRLHGVLDEQVPGARGHSVRSHGGLDDSQVAEEQEA